MNATQRLHDLGQSLWLDNITRDLLNSGTLKRYIDEWSVTGLTSNPTIFDQAIKNSASYDAAIQKGLAAGRSGEELFFDLAIDDITRAADLFGPVHARTAGVDGWVSLEVSPLLAYDTATTTAVAKQLHARAARHNLFIKIPGTKEGLPAIEEATVAGVPINVTLLFSREQYLAAAEAYLRGIERRIAAGLSADVASVASVFISRWDVSVASKVPAAMANTLGIAIGRRCYKAYRDFIASPRYQRVLNNGGRPQRLLFASTGTKDPKASDVLYVKAFAVAADGEHDTGGHVESVRGPWRGRRIASDGRRRLRVGHRSALESRHRRGCARIPTTGRRREIVRQVVARTDGCDRVEKRRARESMNVLVVDVGGTHVKILATGQKDKREFSSGAKLTAKKMVAKVRALAADWQYDVVTVGYPGPLLHQRIAAEPHNLGKGWMGFDFTASFGRPVKLVNDAAMQALGGYRGGRMLFLGFGTGLGTTLIVDGVVEPMELGHLPYKKATYEDYVGARALERMGRKKWSKYVVDVIERLRGALVPDEVLLGGGNARCLEKLPERLSPRRQCRRVRRRVSFVGHDGVRGNGEAFMTVPVGRASRVARARRRITPRCRNNTCANCLRRIRCERIGSASTRAAFISITRRTASATRRCSCWCASRTNPDCATASTRCSAATRSTCLKTARYCTSRCARRKAHRSSSMAPTSCRRCTRCSTG